MILCLTNFSELTVINQTAGPSVDNEVSKVIYHNDPKFSDRQVWANSADRDQTAPRGAV